ncbi:1507_t:CDS:2 [Gigaspora margarita]|uniref:1507_t:CDS:1 n=1 Tax=Gigaspora margarita TaxID=4874 RepID=A0ABN7UFB1_GIGMA|nr:1507_t:CDS:2 [Gigaspora margarita]
MSNEQREPSSDFDLQIKTYIDNVCQATITTLLGRMEEMMNRQAKNQRLWNEQIQKALDKRFSKLEQVSLTASEASNSSRSIPKETQHEQATPATICSQPVMRDELPQGNFLSTPILNNMIIELVSSETSSCTKNGLSIKRSKSHKYPSINYTTLKQLPIVKDFTNPLAVSIETFALSEHGKLAHGESRANLK